MRVMCHAVIALSLLVASANPIRAANPQNEVVLTYRPFANGRELIYLAGDAGAVAVLQEDHRGSEFSGYTAPSEAEKPMFFTIDFPGQENPTIGIAGRSKGESVVYDLLFLDWNQDHTFSDNEILRGTHSKTEDGEVTVFPPVDRTVGTGKRVSVCLFVHDNDHLHAVANGYHEGHVTLAGRLVKIAIVDSNLNGVFGESGNEEEPQDTLLVDLNGNGRFDPTDDAWAAEAMPMGKLKQLTGGKYYRVAVEVDGSRLSVKPDTTPLGRVRLPSAPWALVLQGAQGSLTIHSRQQQASVPAGTYDVKTLMVASQDRHGKRWTAPITAKPGTRLRVIANRSTSLRCGPPFKLELEIEPEGEGYSFNLSLKDSNGNSVDDLRLADGQRPPEPILSITNSSGKVVKTEKFHYG